MSLLRRAARLEENIIQSENAAFGRWLKGLTRAEGLAFMDHCLPALLARQLVPPPPSGLLPSRMTEAQRAAYASQVQAMIAKRSGRKVREVNGLAEIISEHQELMDLWRSFLRKTTGSSSWQ